MNLKVIFKLLEEYLDKEIIPHRENMVSRYSATSFIKNINNELEGIQNLGVLQFQLPELLRFYEKKKNISSSEVCRIADKRYDAIKNRSHSLSEFDKEVLYKIAICFSLTYEETNKLLAYAHLLINQIDNPIDAVFYFFSKRWNYLEKGLTNTENIELFLACHKHAIDYITNGGGNRSWNSIPS